MTPIKTAFGASFIYSYMYAHGYIRLLLLDYSVGLASLYQMVSLWLWYGQNAFAIAHSNTHSSSTLTHFPNK